MKNLSYTKSGPGRKHTEPRKESDVRKDKLDSTLGKIARKYADRYSCGKSDGGKSKRSQFKGFRKVRKIIATGLSAWVPA
jgi:hypothetical protein